MTKMSEVDSRQDNNITGAHLLICLAAQLALEVRSSNVVHDVTIDKGVARIFQRGGHRGYSPDHHPGITDYIWFIPLLSPRVSAGSVVLSRHEGPY